MLWIPSIPGDGVCPPPSTGGRDTVLLSPTLEEPRGSIGIDDGAHVLPFQGPQDALGLAPIDDLELLEQPGMVEQIEQNTFERQRLERALPELGGGDLWDKIGRRVVFGIPVVQSVHVLDQ